MQEIELTLEQVMSFRNQLPEPRSWWNQCRHMGCDRPFVIIMLDANFFNNQSFAVTGSARYTELSFQVKRVTKSYSYEWVPLSHKIIIKSSKEE